VGRAFIPLPGLAVRCLPRISDPPLPIHAPLAATACLPLHSALLGFVIASWHIISDPQPTSINCHPILGRCSVVAALQSAASGFLFYPETASSVLLTAGKLLRGVGGVSCRQNPADFHLLLPTSRGIRPHRLQRDALDLPEPWAMCYTK
jgi:hypothetical protein